VGGEDGEEERWVGGAEREEVGFYCLVYEDWVGGVGSGKEW
jgi:hypothetical protein